MSLECGFSVMTNKNSNISDLFLELQEHHRLGVSMNNHEPETKAWGETDFEEWTDSGGKIMKAIASAPASNMSEILLKTRAAQMIAYLNDDNNDLDRAIVEDDTYESVALSVVRDLLKKDLLTSTA